MVFASLLFDLLSNSLLEFVLRLRMSIYLKVINTDLKDNLLVFG